MMKELVIFDLKKIIALCFHVLSWRGNSDLKFIHERLKTTGEGRKTSTFIGKGGYEGVLGPTAFMRASISEEFGENI